MQARRDEGWTRTDAGKGDDDDDGGADASDDFNIIYVLSAGITSALLSAGITSALLSAGITSALLSAGITSALLSAGITSALLSVVGKIVRRARPRWNARLKCRTSRKKSVRFSSHPYL